MNKRHISCLVVCLVVLLVLICGAIIVHHILLDGLDGLILSATVGSGEDTLYAPGYSPASFRALKRGMQADTVRHYLGDPIEIIPVEKSDKGEWRYRRPAGQYVAWDYSISPSSSHYRERVVILHNDQVVDVIASFYWD